MQPLDLKPFNGGLFLDSKRISFHLFSVFSFIVFLIFTPVSSSSAEINQAGSVTIIDDWGREVTLEKPAERIAFSHTAAGEGILLAGGWDKVIGRDGSLTDPVFFPNIDLIPVINAQNQAFNLDYEKITELHPDLFIIQKHYDSRDQFDEIVNKLEPEIQVVGLDFLDPDSAESISKLGVLIGTEKRANDYVTFHDNMIKKLKEKTDSLSDSEKTRVFLAEGTKGSDAETIATFGEDASFWNEMCTLAGGKNIADELPGDYQNVDLEWLTQQDIDVLIASVTNKLYPESIGYLATDPKHASQKADEKIKKIKDLDVFSHSNAVSNDKVFLLEGAMIYNPKAFIGAIYMAKWLHPDLFADIDPEQVHQDYLTQFIGTDYDLESVGLFGYP